MFAQVVFYPLLWLEICLYALAVTDIDIGSRASRDQLHFRLNFAMCVSNLECYKGTLVRCQKTSEENPMIYSRKRTIVGSDRRQKYRTADSAES